jgi:Cyclic nucleotide-binding domain.
MKIEPILSLLRNVKTRTYQTGEVLISEGSINKEIFYVRKGLIRCLYVNSDEITFQLFPESNPEFIRLKDYIQMFNYNQ